MVGVGGELEGRKGQGSWKGAVGDGEGICRGEKGSLKGGELNDRGAEAAVAGGE